MLFIQASQQFLPRERSEFSKKVCFKFFNSFSLLKMSLQSCLSISRQLIMTEPTGCKNKVYRNMFWEVHIESLGIDFTKGGGEEERVRQGYVGAERKRWGTIPTI